MNRFIKGMFSDYTLGKKMLLLVGILIIMEVIGNVVGLGCGLLEGVVLSKTNTIRLEQLVASSVIFIGTPYVFFYLTANQDCSFAKFFKLTQKNSFILYLLALAALFCFTPAVNFTAYYNEQMTLPESLHWLEEQIKSLEDLAEELTLELLKTDSPLILLFNIIVIGAAPAIGEELMFRGAMQKTLQEKMSPWSAIIITSVVFSALHFQFYGFVPRFLLSIVLGAIFYYGGSIKLNMFAHFCNNTLAVFAYYVCTVLNIPIDDSPTETLGKGDLPPVIIATILSATAIYAIYQFAKKEHNDEGNVEKGNNENIQNNKEVEQTVQIEETCIEDREDENRFKPV